MVGFVNSFPYTKEICSDGWWWWWGLIRCENKGLRGVGRGSFCFVLFLFFLYKVSLMLWCLDLEL